MIRFKKIICPVDFFKTSSRAFDYSLKLAGHYGARVHALHIVAPMIPAAYGAPFSIEDLTADLAKESRRFLLKLKTRAAKTGVSVTTDVQVGDVDHEILRSAAKEKADLIVVGTHGRRGFERLVLGSVTERLIRRSPVPVIAIGPPRSARALPPDIRRILVTTDFSEGTSDAVSTALSIARECQARVTLLHVVHELAVDVSGKYREPLLRGVENQLQQLVPEDALDWCDVETRVDSGTPSEVILKTLKAGKFDLLVMNIHGKGFLDRALIGSTAERTLRSATEVCPVLLIPPLKAPSKKSK